MENSLAQDLSSCTRAELEHRCLPQKSPPDRAGTRGSQSLQCAGTPRGSLLRMYLLSFEDFLWRTFSRRTSFSCTRAELEIQMPATKKPPDRAGGFLVAGIAGLEPARAGVKVLCLNRLGYIPISGLNCSTTSGGCQRVTPKRCRFGRFPILWLLRQGYGSGDGGRADFHLTFRAGRDTLSSDKHGRRV